MYKKEFMEIDAIRKAEAKLKTYDLSGCELYTTGGALSDVSGGNFVGKYQKGILWMQAK